MEFTPTDPAHRERSNPTTTVVRKVVVGSVGGVVTAAGVVMLATPGPGILVSLAGLGILAREFPSAAHQLERIRRIARRGRPEQD